MRAVALALVLFSIPALCSAQECQTSEADLWLCNGDPAWVNGYLISPDIFDLRDCQDWEAKAALVPELQAERDTFRDQRDKALLETDILRGDLAAALAFGDSEAERAARLEADLGDSFDTVDVALIAGGTGLGAVLLGVLVGALAM